jgi:hypothetical protein
MCPRSREGRFVASRNAKRCVRASSEHSVSTSRGWFFATQYA